MSLCATGGQDQSVCLELVSCFLWPPIASINQLVAGLLKGSARFPCEPQAANSTQSGSLRSSNAGQLLAGRRP